MEKEVILCFPKEIQKEVLRDALKEDQFNVFFVLSKVLLDAPFEKGGMSTEEIEEIRKEFF
jgi:hypothetical protein